MESAGHCQHGPGASEWLWQLWPVLVWLAFFSPSSTPRLLAACTSRVSFSSIGPWSLPAPSCYSLMPKAHQTCCGRQQMLRTSIGHSPMQSPWPPQFLCHRWQHLRGCVLNSCFRNEMQHPRKGFMTLSFRGSPTRHEESAQ